MLMLELALAALLIIAFIVVLRAFDRHCARKFGHRFFTKMTFVATAIACALLVLGLHWHASALRTHGDTLNGLIVAAIGVLILLVMAFNNVSSTSLLYGLGGTAIQIPLFVGLTYAGWPLFIAGGAISILVAGAKRSDPVIDQPYEQHRFY